MSDSSSQRKRVILFYTGFVALFALGVVLLSLSLGLFVAPDPPMTANSQTPLPLDEREFSESVHIVVTLDEWKSLLQTGRHILFVDCDWNVEMVLFRRTFSAFANWCREETNYQAASVKMIPYADYESSTAVAKLSTAVQELMRSNEIFQGGLKTYGGSGRIIWLEDGRVLDYEWCFEFLNEPSQLKARSRNAFQ